ncbi:30S ribosomal protein S12 methylthiotransferase RimO [Porphyromonas levii]|uniref:30S ribosomal protein S12 methylthiotransferase RimO n=1 Tax=Porphyromonas levii TaxID=28114 RepID=UPI001B8AC93F|nr:30S ribosomal protein S12 methylthiotransferase RimO [Porphyromonas levii]MBR8764300.1 Ribosomal protein S12 methylthiotransferase RimO [Porphyromonas levii]MBR8766246.1 Ribosomal protein S12 methylthiotransferase RimO [Porphyromonas levii]MBR8769860.1 Ribosomal protein S12 methylthiotransferase RimO [Porphyromonas levii]MBR8785185.1 Ribosomal protein S12 methylthiotransferase RimO [Porphyromonas levii]MBR8802713.1 Ribosomal protein S12 methylthiotransferase RimO [Porphyromonas levii]
MRKNRVDVITMGCSKNLVDSEQLMRQFASNGYQVEHDAEIPQGEIVVINTCGFIESAREESINTILQLVEGKKEGRVGKVYVMGCLSERYMEELKAEIPEVDGWYGKFNWKGLLSEIGKAYHTSPADARLLSTPSHYAYVKVSEGCDRTCAYCSIPLITGKHVSRPMEEILEEVEGLAKRGVKELQLIAQDLTYYGLDLYKEHRIAQLVRAICRIDGIEWVRLHYAYPNHFPYELLEVIKEEPKVCKYLDIALQHISNPVLKAMRRNVGKEETLALIQRIREEVPGIYLRTTLMVGHPGETEEAYQELIDFVKEVRFERMGAFSYSHEEGTYGFKHYEDEIAPQVKHNRLERLMNIQQEIAFEQAERLVCTTQKVIIDRGAEGYYIGRTQYDSPDVDPEVLIPTEEVLTIGAFYDVRITEADGFDTIGALV